MSAKEKALSPTMLEAIAYIEQHGGTIHYHTGGYWAHNDWDGEGPHFGKQTIRGLIERGLLEWSARSPRGAYPVAATLTEKARG